MYITAGWEQIRLGIVCISLYCPDDIQHLSSPKIGVFINILIELYLHNNIIKAIRYVLTEVSSIGRQWASLFSIITITQHEIAGNLRALLNINVIALLGVT